MRKIVAGLFLLAPTSASVGAQVAARTPPTTVTATAVRHFNYRGLKFGDSLPERFVRRLTCTTSTPDPVVRTCLLKRDSIGPVPLSTGFGTVVGRLYTVSWMYEPSQFLDVVEVLTGRFGEPSSRVESLLRSPDGVALNNTTVSWVFEEGTLDASQYVASSAQGGAAIVNTNFAEEAKWRRERLRAAGKADSVLKP